MRSRLGERHRQGEGDGRHWLLRHGLCLCCERLSAIDSDRDRLDEVRLGPPGAQRQTSDGEGHAGRNRFVVSRMLYVHRRHLRSLLPAEFVSVLVSPIKPRNIVTPQHSRTRERRGPPGGRDRTRSDLALRSGVNGVCGRAERFDLADPLRANKRPSVDKRRESVREARPLVPATAGRSAAMWYAAETKEVAPSAPLSVGHVGERSS
jgi:hypothetical protein